jgi:PepB aminopeptidase
MESICKVTLVNQPALNDWQRDNLIQINEDNLYIYVAVDNRFPLQSIQKAARGIEKMGVKFAKLVGDLWDNDTQWSFALGFTCVDKLTSVEFTGDESSINALNDKLAVFGWARDLTNHTPTQLPPENLANAAVDYIT